MSVVPYLSFEGRCEEALEFYKSAVGAEVTMLMRYSEMPPQAGPSHVTPDMEAKIMHASIKVAGSEINLSDGMCRGSQMYHGVSLALRVSDVAEADRLFDALAAGGQVHQPMMETFFSPRFGMLADKFGVAWMVLVYPQ